MSYDGSLTFDTAIDPEGFNKGTSSLSKQANGLKKTLAGLGKTIASVFAVTQLVKFGKQAVSLASDIQEVQNVVDTAFGDLKYKMESFAESAIEMYGISKLTAKQTGSTFMAMAKGMGIADEAASDISIQLTALSADMSSFYNKSQDITSTALKSIFTGETETLKQFGVVMTEANLEAFRFAQGIEKSYKNMSQAEKVALRYNYVIEQTKLSQGDFTKTQNSWANQTRILSERWKEFLSVLGNGLVKVLTPLVQVLNTVLQYIIAFANAIGQLLGGEVEKQEAVSSAIESSVENQNDLTKATKETAKANKKTLASFDEIQKLTSSSNSDEENAIGGGIGFEIATPYEFQFDTQNIDIGLDKITEKIKKLNELIAPLKDFTITAFVDFYENFLKPIGEWTIGKGFPTFVDSIKNGLQKINFDVINNALNNLWLSLTPFVTNVGEGLLWFWINVLQPMGLWTINNVIPSFLDLLSIGLDVLNSIIEIFKPWGEWFWENFLKPIGAWTGGVIVSVLTKLVNKLNEFSNWISENQVLVENIIIVIGSFAAAWAGATLVMNLWNIAVGVWNSIGAIATTVTSAFGTAVAFLTSPITLITLGIGALIAIIVLLIKNWDTVKEVAANCWENIKLAWQGVANWFNTNIVTPISDFFGGLWKGIKSGASVLADFMKQKVIEPIVKLFKNMYNSVIGIIEGLINGFIGIINGFIRGINSVIGIINEIPGVTLPHLKQMEIVQIPRLATGTVVPANYGEFAAILGDNKRETEVVSPLSTMKQALVEALQEYGGQNITINFEESSIGDLVRLLKPYIDKENRRIGSSTRVAGGAY